MLKSRSAFVATGLAVNGLVLARGLVLMVALDYEALGYVGLVQVAMACVGLLHFGVLNGGYRLLCHARPRTQQRIVDLAYTAFAAIGAALILGAGMVSFAMNHPTYHSIAVFSVVGGLATLIRSWVHNELVAGQRLSAVNAINAASTLASLAILALLITDRPIVAPEWIAVSAIAAQPILFVAIALMSGAAKRPRALRFSKLMARPIFAAGFALFLTGLALQIIPLIERVYVSRTLGLEALGQLYLSILFIALFQIVPNLVQQVFLAPMVELWRRKDLPTLRRDMRRLMGLITAYCAVAATALTFLAEPILTAILPEYAPDLRWVYLIAPGLIAFALAGPFALCFNILIDYRWHLGAYGAGLMTATVSFGVAFVSDTPLTLDQVTLIRSFVFALMGLILVIGTTRIHKTAPHFRLFQARQSLS
ncbi:MAG: hypothetical protein AAF251_11070 [Pseudomonadota bacterium]